MKTQSFENTELSEVRRLTPFVLQAPKARQVYLAGDFNDWETEAGPMHKGHDGAWHSSLALKPGRYEYRFVVDDEWCNDPTAPQKVMNSVGSENCMRIV